MNGDFISSELTNTAIKYWTNAGLTDLFSHCNKMIGRLGAVFLCCVLGCRAELPLCHQEAQQCNVEYYEDRYDDNDNDNDDNDDKVKYYEDRPPFEPNTNLLEAGVNIRPHDEMIVK